MSKSGTRYIPPTREFDVHELLHLHHRHHAIGAVVYHPRYIYVDVLRKSTRELRSLHMTECPQELFAQTVSFREERTVIYPPRATGNEAS